MRACHGFFLLMAYNAVYTYYIEALTQKQRSTQGALSDVVTGLVPCLYALIGYVCRDWRVQTYVIGALNIAVLLVLWFLPESKKWLATQKTEIRQNRDKFERIREALRGNVRQFGMIFKSKPILRVCFIMVSMIFLMDFKLEFKMLIWSTAPLCWMVISFSVGELFGNIFLNTAIMGIADLVANCILLLVTRFFKRQVLTSLNFLCLGACLITNSVLRGFYYESTRVADVSVMMMAKFFASSSFSINYVR